MGNVLDRIGNFLLKWRISKKTLAIIFVILFVLSLVPIIITAFYSVPGADDYGFGKRAYQAIASGNSFWSGVFESFIFYYYNWQGFYTANLFFSMQPFTMNIHYYWIMNILFLVVICVSLFYFIKVITLNVLHSNITDFLLISIPIVTLFLQFMPGIQQAIYNTVAGFSLVVNTIYLVISAFIIQYHLNYTSDNKKKWFYCIGAVLLTVIFSGVAPIIFVTVLMAYVPALMICIKNKFKTYRLLVVIISIVSLGFLISALAPGNAVRQSTTKGLSFFNAIIKAMIMSVYQFGLWSTIFYISVLLFISVVFYNIAKTSKFQFKYPLLVFFYLYLIYAGRISIQYYATGSIGGWRQLNEHYLGFIMCISASFLYFIGWLSKRSIISKNKLNTGEHFISKKISIVFVFVVAFLFVSGSISYGYDHVITSVSTSLSLMKGETQKYNSEMMDRISIFTHSSEKNLIVQPLTVYPAFFGDDTITPDKDYFTNQEVANYYDKESIVLKVK